MSPSISIGISVDLAEKLGAPISRGGRHEILSTRYILRHEDQSSSQRITSLIYVDGRVISSLFTTDMFFLETWPAGFCGIKDKTGDRLCLLSGRLLFLSSCLYSRLFASVFCMDKFTLRLLFFNAIKYSYTKPR